MKPTHLFSIISAMLIFAGLQIAGAGKAEAFCVINNKKSDSSIHLYVLDAWQNPFKKVVKPGQKECCKSSSSGKHGCNSFEGNKRMKTVRLLTHIGKFRKVADGKNTYGTIYKKLPDPAFEMAIHHQALVDCSTGGGGIHCASMDPYKEWYTAKPVRLKLDPQNTATFSNVLLMGPGGKCLDVAGASKKDGAQVILWKCHGKANQRWNIEKSGRIKSVHSNKCLDVWGNGKITIYGCHGGYQHFWDAKGRKLISKRGMVRSQNGPFCLSSSDKKSVTVSACKKNDDSQFWFIADEPA